MVNPENVASGSDAATTATHVSSRISRVRIKQSSLIATFKRAVENSATANARNSTSELIRGRLDRLEHNWNYFNEVQENMEELCGENESELHVQFETRGQVEEYYIITKERLRILLGELEPRADNEADRTTAASMEMKLPRINILVFSALSNAQKLHYLKSNLTGEAALLLRSFQVTDANYEEAWSVLSNRYDNKRFIIDAHLRTLMTQPCVTVESAASLRKLLDTSVEAVRALKVLGQPVTYWNSILVYVIVGKLDLETHRQWELQLDRSHLPTFLELESFLEARWKSLEMVSEPKRNTNNSRRPQIQSNINKTKQQNSTQSFIATAPNLENCSLCKSTEHLIYKCTQFKNLLYDQRIQIVREQRLCFNCLRPGHGSKFCKSGKCFVCQRKHHSLLHGDSNPQEPSSKTTGDTVLPSFSQRSVNTTSMEITSHLSNGSDSQVLLSTALVIIQNDHGAQFVVKALLDSGSQATFVTEATARRIGLKMKPTSIKINGVGRSDVGRALSVVQFTIRSRVHNKFALNVEALTLDRITNCLPTAEFTPRKSWHHLNGIILADPEYHKPSNIELLIGADILSTLMLEGQLKGCSGSPVAQNCIFGWILAGRIDTSAQSDNILNFHISCDQVDSTLRQFWEIEDIQTTRTPTMLEKECESHFMSTHVRNSDGRYTVSLPFKESCTKPLGKSRNASILRLYQMERRFAGNPKLLKQYSEFMDEYLRLGHMELIPESEIHKPEHQVFYMPHHAVIKNSSSTTKLRVVFDASKKSTSGISLNDKLLIGQTLQQNLSAIIIRWRTHKYVFSADIGKMYRQTRVAKVDTDFQRIVWRRSPMEPIRDYRLLTVTYETSCAPFLAIRTLMQLAHDERINFPIASMITERDFYVDDVMSGGNSMRDVLDIQQQLISMMNSAGFLLRKWSANYQGILDAVRPEHREQDILLHLDLDESIKTLGIHWNQTSDQFGFRIRLPDAQKLPPTKRNLLSEAATLFDPLGWLSPIIIVAKILFQSLWIAGVGWDRELPQEIAKQWMSYRENLHYIENIKISRWLGTGEHTSLELHGFSDASSVAYSAVVYSRIVRNDGSIQINIVSAKTKVAPIKTISVPRLELCGAVLLA